MPARMDSSGGTGQLLRQSVTGVSVEIKKAAHSEKGRSPEGGQLATHSSDIPFVNSSLPRVSPQPDRLSNFLQVS